MFKSFLIHSRRCVAVFLAMIIMTSVAVFAEDNEQQVSSAPADTKASAVSGWINQNGKIKYVLPDNSYCKGFKRISGKIYYFNSDGSVAVGLKKIGKKSFYFSKFGSVGKKGVLNTGWKKLGKYTYFFKTTGKLGDKGKMLKNCIAGNKKLGFAYVSDRGIKITSKEMKLAVKFVRKHTSSKKSKAKRLRQCFYYIKKHFPYYRIYIQPNSKNLSKSFAEFTFKNKKGNCYGLISAFSCAAKALGYKVRLNAGKITTKAGGPDAHGWAEIKMGKKWYLFDISMHSRMGVNLYKKLKGQYPHKYKMEKRYNLSFKGKKLVWKAA